MARIAGGAESLNSRAMEKEDPRAIARSPMRSSRRSAAANTRSATRCRPREKLCTACGASRNTVREALRQALDIGLIDRRRRSGTRVCSRTQVRSLPPARRRPVPLDPARAAHSADREVRVAGAAAGLPRRDGIAPALAARRRPLAPADGAGADRPDRDLSSTPSTGTSRTCPTSATASSTARSTSSTPTSSASSATNWSRPCSTRGRRRCCWPPPWGQCRPCWSRGAAATDEQERLIEVAIDHFAAGRYSYSVSYWRGPPPSGEEPAEAGRGPD